LKRLYLSLLTLILLLLSVFNGELQAQRRQPDNLPKYDLQPYHFGFTLGFNQMFFTIKPIEDFEFTDTIYTITCDPGRGFNIGIVSNLRLAEYLDLRFIPTLSFGDRILIFTEKGNDTLYYETKKQIESAYIDFPFELKFKSKRLHNMRAYVLTGIKYSMDLASQAKKREQTEEIQLKLKKNDVAAEFGVGFDFYTNYFKFGTEIKMMYGLRDMLEHEPNRYADAIQNMKSKIFQITFTFE
jgi:hypothetical protein